jgi:Domain of unknown function (DUF4160)
MSTVRAGGVCFRVHPQDHEPVHAHGSYGGAVVIVELRTDRTVTIADRGDAIIPGNAKKNAIRKILREAAASFDAIVEAWERMHQ